MRKIDDYTSTREIITNCKVYYPSEVSINFNNTSHRIFFRIPDKIRRVMGICRNTEKQFKIIIVRKGE